MPRWVLSRTSFHVLLGGSAIASLLTACGPNPPHAGVASPDAGGAVSLVSLAITPATQTILMTAGAPPTTVQLRATASYTDGSTRDVTADSAWSLDDPQLGALTAGAFTTGTVGGTTAVHAFFQTKTATASLLVKARLTRLEPGAPANAASLFAAASADPARAPAVVYPYDGVLLPPNLGRLEAQWSDTAGDDLFEVSIESPVTDVTLYTGTPKYAFEPDVWTLVASSNQDAQAALTVAGLVSSSPATAGASSAVRLRFARTPVSGGIYYWSADASAPSMEGVFRYGFGSAGASAGAPYYTETQASSHCVACHVLTRDGTRMAVTYDGGNGPAGMIDVKTATPLFDWTAGVAWNFASFFPDGNSLIGSSGGVLTLYRIGASSAMQVGKVPLPSGALGGTHPDVAPDGSEVVYAYMPPSSCASTYPVDWQTVGDGIAAAPFAGGSFGTPSVLVPPDPSCAQNHYYPSYSPDGKWILFNQSSGNTYNNADAAVYLLPSAGGAPIALASVNAIGPTNSWPRWSPFAGTYAGTPIFWITFSSQRDYGVELVGLKRAQIWMAAVSPSSGGADPSYPPFWLPFQDMATPNHIAQWTTALIR